MVQRNHLEASRFSTVLPDLDQQTADSTHDTAHIDAPENTAPVTFNIMQGVTIEELTKDNDQLERALIAVSKDFTIKDEIIEYLITQREELVDRKLAPSKDNRDPSDTRREIKHLTLIKQLTLEVKRLKAELEVAHKQRKNTLETQKLIDHLAKENRQLKEERAIAEEHKGKKRPDDELSTHREHLKSTTDMEKRIQELEEKNNRLNKNLAVANKNPKAAPKTEKKIEKLKEQKASLKKEVAFLRQREIDMKFKECHKANQDGVSKDMAKVLKRYYEMEEQFGQMKIQIKKDLETLHAENEQKIQRKVEDRLTENEQKIQKQLAECFEDNKKSIQEHGKEIKQQIEERLGENEMRYREHDKQVQERLGVNEVIWGHAQEMKQHVKESLAGHNQKIKESISEHDYKMKESIVRHDHQIKESIARNDQNIKERLDECLKDNEKRMQEHEKKVQGQADHILASARHMEQAAHKAVDAHAVVLSEINEQGYFTRMIPMKKIPDGMVQVTGVHGEGCLYVQRNKIPTYNHFRSLIKSAWGLTLSNNCYIHVWDQGSFYSGYRRITITPDSGCLNGHKFTCTN